MTLTTFFRKPGGAWQVFCSAFRQIRGVTLLYTAVLLVVFPLLFFFYLGSEANRLSAYSDAEAGLSLSAGQFLRDAAAFAAPPILCVFAVAFTVSLFRYLQDKRSVDLFHALPIRRGTMLLGRLAAAFAALAAPFLAALLLCVLIAACYGAAGFALGEIFRQAAFTLLLELVFLLMMIFFLVCCGTVFDAVVSTLAFCGGLPLLVFLACQFLSMALPGYGASQIPSWVYLRMNPLLGFFRNFWQSPATWEDFLWWLCYGAVCLAACLALYRERPSEAAENAFAFPIPRILVRFLVSGCAGFCLGFLIRSLAPGFPFAVSVLLGAFLAHLILEAVYRRGLKGVWRTMPAYGVFAGVFLAFFLVCCTGCFGYYSRIPAAGEVKAVVYSSEAYGAYYQQLFSQEGAYTWDLSPTLQEPEDVEQALALHEEIIRQYRAMGPLFPLNNGYPRYQFRYYLKDGSVLERTFFLDSQELDRQAQALASLPESVRTAEPAFYLSADSFDAITLDHWSSGASSTVLLSGDERQRLLSALQADLLALGGSFDAVWEEDGVSLRLLHQQNGELRSGLPIELDSAHPVGSLVDQTQAPFAVVPPSYELGEESYPNTWALLEEMGWLTPSQGDGAAG